MIQIYSAESNRKSILRLRSSEKSIATPLLENPHGVAHLGKIYELIIHSLIASGRARINPIINS